MYLSIRTMEKVQNVCEFKVVKMGKTNYLYVGSIVIKFGKSVLSVTKSHSKFCPLVDLCSLARTVTSATVGLSFELRPVSMLWVLTHSGEWRVKTLTVSIDPDKPN